VPHVGTADATPEWPCRSAGEAVAVPHAAAALRSVTQLREATAAAPPQAPRR